MSTPRCYQSLAQAECLTGLLSVPRVTVTGSSDEVKTRHDLETHHEEADNIIVQQVLKCGAKAVSVISDDTDVFILLLHYYQKANLAIPITMESPSQGRVATDIKGTDKKHAKIVKELLPAHVISGCDTVGTYHGISKETVVNMLKARHKLSAIGDTDCSHEEVMRQATKFISPCYGYPNLKSLSEARLFVWAKKNGKKSHFSTKTLCDTSNN